MKKILILSIQHTGTFFASKTLAAAYPDSHLRIGSLYDKHIKLGHQRYVTEGVTELSDFYQPTSVVGKDFVEKTVLEVCKKEDIKDKDIVIGHEHFHKADSWILKALIAAPAECPIVIPTRDPILSLHSKMWREIEHHNNKQGGKEKSRRRRLKKWIDMYKKILSIPKGHVFLLPIDAEQSKSEGTRIQLIKDMYRYCDVEFNNTAFKEAQAWSPTNTTDILIRKEHEKIPSPRWENFKERYLAGDIAHTKAIMGMEFEELNKEEKLKELMKKAGYKNVLWW